MDDFGISAFSRKIHEFGSKQYHAGTVGKQITPTFCRKKLSVLGIKDNKPYGECLFVALQPLSCPNRYVPKNFQRFSSATAHNALPKINTVVMVSKPNQILNTAMTLNTMSLSGDKVCELPAGNERVACDIHTSVIPQEIVLSDFLQDYVLHTPERDNRESAYQMRRRTALLLDREINANQSALAHISDMLRYMYIVYRLRTWEQEYGKLPGYCEYYDCDKWELNELIKLASLLITITHKENIDRGDTEGAKTRLQLIDSYFLMGRNAAPESVKQLQEQITELWLEILRKKGKNPKKDTCLIHQCIWKNEIFSFLEAVFKKYNDNKLLSVLYGNRLQFPYLSNEAEKRVTAKTGLISSENSDFIAAYLYSPTRLETLTMTEEGILRIFLKHHATYATRSFCYLSVQPITDRNGLHKDPIALCKELHDEDMEGVLKSGFIYTANDVRKFTPGFYIDEKLEVSIDSLPSISEDGIIQVNPKSLSMMFTKNVSALIMSFIIESMNEFEERQLTHLIPQRYIACQSIMSENSWIPDPVKLKLADFDFQSEHKRSALSCCISMIMKSTFFIRDEQELPTTTETNYLKEARLFINTLDRCMPREA
ncbi:hypothetical protein ElyMa_002597200 [Elysia marginata]|uniref:Uncharacterized protein n=1 Tax=Elysia marginata TaxID=1093978 RepID=A0AAV4H4Q1_9GAST|nr:hypothetical protein ElyMa_002597200 [Elysia marginata]